MQQSGKKKLDFQHCHGGVWGGATFYFDPVAGMFQISVGCELRFYTGNISTYMNL